MKTFIALAFTLAITIAYMSGYRTLIYRVDGHDVYFPNICDSAHGDLTAQLQALFDATSGDRIVLPPGYCRVRPGVLSLSKVGQRLSGAGRDVTFIACTNASGVCLTVSGATGNSLDKLSITTQGSYQPGTTAPTAATGSIGLKWTAGSYLSIDTIHIRNFETCGYFGPVNGTSPVTMHALEYWASLCKSSYVTNDGTPELTFVAGRLGENGGNDYNSDYFFYSTKTVAGSGGSGPNTLVIDSMQINPGNKTIGCAFAWGNFAATPGGGYQANKIINSHVEVLSGSGYSGSAPRGMICVDSTVPHFPGMQIINTDMGEDGSKSIPFFNIDPAVPWDEEFILSDDLLCSAASSTTISAVAGNHKPTLSDDYLCGTQTFVAGDTSAVLKIHGVVYSTAVLSGQWKFVDLNGNLGTLTDTAASGDIHETNDQVRSWTPVLNIGAGTPTAYTATGSIERSSIGGYDAFYDITISTLGAATGNVTISNIPYTCSGKYGSESVTVEANFTGLTGALNAVTNATATTATIAQSNATGQSPITHANLTNTTSLQGFIRCGTVQ